jgi:signal transduction histidine kinase
MTSQLAIENAPAIVHECPRPLAGYINPLVANIAPLLFFCLPSQPSHFSTLLYSELRTPLNGIIGITELLGYTELTPDQREHVDTLKTCSRALLNNINDVCALTYAISPLDFRFKSKRTLSQ